MPSNGGYHTSENSHRSRAVEAGMDVQILAGRRVDLDRPERRILERVAKEIAWLLEHDTAENHDHEALAACGKEICGHLEKLKIEKPTACRQSAQTKRAR